VQDFKIHAIITSKDNSFFAHSSYLARSEAIEIVAERLVSLVVILHHLLWDV
jgi:hypothetical protein